MRSLQGQEEKQRVRSPDVLSISAPQRPCEGAGKRVLNLMPSPTCVGFWLLALCYLTISPVLTHRA